MQRQGRLLGERPVALHRRRSRSPAPLGLILALALAGAPSAHAAEGPRAREGFSSASAAAFAPGGASSLDLRAAAVLGGDSAAPTVTLAPVALVSSYSTPAFSGAASDSTPVTVSVYEGASAEGEPVATLQAPVQAGSWSSSEVSPPLGAGLYTAVAREPSSLGGPTGASREVSFEINPGAPALTLSSPPSRSHNTSPSFAGKSSEGGEVTVEVFEGTRPAGPLFAVLKASVAGGSWSTEPVSPALPQGRHTFTAVAVQAGAISKVTGRSAPVTFAVDTEPPTVTLTLPQSPSNHTTPAFSGTSSEAGEVTVQVYAGSSAAGTPIASATASPPAGGGGWTTKPAQPALGEGTFTAVATQQSGLGNPAGTSAPVTFVVDTSSPTVTINAPVSPSANRVPSFSGSASDRTPVSVEVYAGARPEGAVVASATAEAGGGRWVSAKASPALAWGEYTAVATQPSSIQNPTGTSAPVSFAVQPIAPTAATEAATDVTRTSAALYALVNPNAAGVSSCSFEYGATPTYGRSVECGFVSGAGAFPPAGTSAVAVFVRIYGLAPATGYHFRIVAVGEGGTAQGSDATFTTQPPWLFGEQARGGVSASRSVPAAGEIAALIARAMSPRGRAASITALLASGAFKTTLEVGETGSALVDWFYLPRAARRAGERTHPPVLVAAATLTLRGNEAVALKVRLSSAGKRLLRAARRMRLTATCTFTPTQGSPGESAATFELHR